MSEFQRQHPVAAITRAVELVRGNLVTIIVLMVVGASGSGGVAFIWWFAGLFLFVLIAGIVGWMRFVYRVHDGELQIRQGVFVRKNLYLTRDRIQVIDITSGVIQRMFGLVSLEIKTAGSSSREASLSAVSRAEAERLVELLRNGTSLSEQADVEFESEDGPKEYPEYYLPVKELIIAASTSGSFGIALSIIATIFSQIEPLISESEVYEWFLAAIPSETDTMLVLGFLVVFVIFAWLMSFFGTLLKYGAFSLTLKEEEMIVKRGIFEKKRITVPFNRIQAVRITEGIMRQPFGYATVHVESAGYGDQKNSGSVVVFPLLKREKIEKFLNLILPDYQGLVKAEKPPSKALFRYMLRSSAVWALVVTGIYFLFSAPAWIWILVIPGIAWGWLRHRDAAVGVDRQRIVLRNRLVARTTAIIRKNRAQDLNISSSWIQQWRGLANIEVSVASGDQGRRFRIRDLEFDVAFRLLPWITKEADDLVMAETDRLSKSLIPDWGSREA